MKKLGQGVLAALVASMLCAGSLWPRPRSRVIATKPQKVGNGWARAYVALDANGNARAWGEHDKDALAGLPKEPNRTSRCFDKNGNGKMDEHECLGDFAFIFALPEGEAAKAVAPFTWVSLNWNPHGHIPPPRRPGPAHFDFHFYIQEREAVKRIRTGTCGEVIDRGLQEGNQGGPGEVHSP